MVLASVVFSVVSVSVVPEVRKFAPGVPFDVAIKADLADGWHSYWLNPGDSGAAPKIDWQLPRGWRTDSPRFPTPKRIPMEGQMTYGYENGTYFLVRITPPAKTGLNVTLRGTSKWMVCQETCVMENHGVVFDMVRANSSLANPEWKETWRTSLPGAQRGWSFSARRVKGNIVLRIGGAGALGEGTYFFAGSGGIVNHQAAQVWTADARGQSITIPVSEFASGPIKRLRGVLQPGNGEAGVKIVVTVVQ